MDDILFDESNTALQVTATSWEEAVRIGGELLVQQGCVEKSYIDGMIQKVKKHRVDVVISKDLAIPHARYECGAFRMGCSFVTLKNPLSFAGSEEKVKALFCFSAMDLPQYWHMVSLALDLIEYDLVYELAQAKDIGEVLILLKRAGF